MTLHNFLDGYVKEKWFFPCKNRFEFQSWHASVMFKNRKSLFQVETKLVKLRNVLLLFKPTLKVLH